MDKATNLAVAPDDPPSIEERLAAGSADDALVAAGGTAAYKSRYACRCRQKSGMNEW